MDETTLPPDRPSRQEVESWDVSGDALSRVASEMRLLELAIWGLYSCGEALEPDVHIAPVLGLASTLRVRQEGLRDGDPRQVHSGRYH